MAQKLHVPPRDEPLLAKFVRMPADEVQSLVKSLREERPTLDIEALADSISDRLSVDRGQTREVLRLLRNLSFTRQSLGAPIDDFVVALRDAIEATGKAEIVPENWATFQGSMADMLSVEALSLSTKAMDVQVDNERNYCYARILTDLRPVFRSDDVEEAPPAMVAVHTLKITYHANGAHEDFFVALDRSDLQQLASLLDRALKKEQSLKKMVGESNITFLEVRS